MRVLGLVSLLYPAFLPVSQVVIFNTSFTRFLSVHQKCSSPHSLLPSPWPPSLELRMRILASLHAAYIFHPLQHYGINNMMFSYLAMLMPLTPRRVFVLLPRACICRAPFFLASLQPCVIAACDLNQRRGKSSYKYCSIPVHLC